MLRLESLKLTNFRCFADLAMTFEPDLTVLYAENAGGKTALLSAIAIGLDLLQPTHSRHRSLKRDDVRRGPGEGVLGEPVGPASLVWTATFGEWQHVAWTAGHTGKTARIRPITEDALKAVESVRKKGERWPLIAYYGTARFAQERRSGRNLQAHTDRWWGYEGALDPSASEEVLLRWLMREALSDFARFRRNEAERRFDRAVFQAIQRATPGLQEVFYEPTLEAPMFRFAKQGTLPWTELSDGYHLYVCLVADIARRAVILNDFDGLEAPTHIEGIVMIDEIDLHLHPRWQRRVIEGLRAAFPKLQLIVTTHSPQVLSTARNHQVRRLVNYEVKTSRLFVEGRDTNAILREQMDTDERAPQGMEMLKALYRAMDEGQWAAAKEKLGFLRSKWGEDDPEVMRAQAFIEDEEASEREEG